MLMMSMALDMFFTAVSLGIAAMCNPLRVLRQVWPYVCVLGFFVGFVVWNGGVVLGEIKSGSFLGTEPSFSDICVIAAGDKSNHVATIHLAQMLYLWPFFAFFSLPLVLPYALTLVDVAGNLSRFKPGLPSAPSSSTQSQRDKQCLVGAKSTKARPAAPRQSPATRAVTSLLSAKYPIWGTYLFTTLVASVLVVRHNTIVHPFTLADNRHYMFYIFRHTIRRGTLVRTLLVIPYTISRWLIWGVLAGTLYWTPGSSRRGRSDTSSHVSSRLGSRRKAQKPGKERLRNEPNQDAGATPSSSIPNGMIIPTSTALIWLVATSLSLVTAPLVEPRYFIVPWVMWRLLVPPWALSRHRGYSSSLIRKGISVLNEHDLRLPLETVWFLAINAVTGYIFLKKPYAWKDESGRILDEGRLQRFMW